MKASENYDLKQALLDGSVVSPAGLMLSLDVC